MKQLYKFLPLLCLGFFSCKHAPVIPDDPAVSFSADIQPMLTGNCNSSGCHDAGASTVGTFPLLTYDDVMSHGEIKAKDAKKSKLYNAVKGSGEEIMPKEPAAPLTDKQQKLIYVWIMQGAKNN